MSVRITNIQHFCLHDGPGIRTTVFLKGCNLKCPWCANPECISFELEKDFGQDISLDDLERELLKDKPYYSLNEGGVTFSGGEPLLQIKELEPLLASLNNQNIHICFETALFIRKNILELAIPYVNEFIVDVKILTPDECKGILGGNVDIYLENLEFLFSQNKKVTFRIPVCKPVLKEDNIRLILDLISAHKPNNVEIFKIHNLAREKYAKLGRQFYQSSISDEEISDLSDRIKNIFPEVIMLEL